MSALPTRTAPRLQAMHITADGCRLAYSVAGARVVELDAAHLANVERPEAFNAAVIEFLTH